MLFWQEVKSGSELRQQYGVPPDFGDAARTLAASCLPADGWYVASYVMRFVHVDPPAGGVRTSGGRRGRTPCWCGRRRHRRRGTERGFVTRGGAAEPYENALGETVCWKFVGISDLLPVYEKLEDGAEIMSTDHASRTLGRIRQMVRPLEDFVRYADEA